MARTYSSDWAAWVGGAPGAFAFAFAFAVASLAVTNVQVQANRAQRRSRREAGLRDIMV